MNHHTRPPRRKPTSALDIRSEIMHYRFLLSGGTKTKSGKCIFDILADLRRDLAKLEPWLVE